MLGTFCVQSVAVLMKNNWMQEIHITFYDSNFDPDQFEFAGEEALTWFPDAIGFGFCEAELELVVLCPVDQLDDVLTKAETFPHANFTSVGFPDDNDEVLERHPIHPVRYVVNRLKENLIAS